MNAEPRQPLPELVGPPQRRPTVEEAKLNLLAEDLDLSPSLPAADWARKHGVTISVAAGLAGLLFYKSRTIRRVAMAALLAPAVRREITRRAGDLVRMLLSSKP